MPFASNQRKKFVGDGGFNKKKNKTNAHMVVFGGDLVDEGVPNSFEVLDMFLQNCDLPNEKYAVSGNHDLWTGKFDYLKNHLESKFNITFLENKSKIVTKDGNSIKLYGISDPEIWDFEKASNRVEEAINQFTVDDSKFNVLIFHRANMLDMFNDKKFDLILSGHMHGGQIRIPFVGGLKSPHGDWFPKYSGGRYDVNNNTYIVSRGIGNAVSVPRIFNRPEIVVITLKKG